MMRQSRRLWQIIRTFRRFGLGELLPDRRVLRWLSAGGRHEDPPGQRVREALESLGPVFVKFGQTLSTRRDLLPPDYANELARLQDRVPPFDGALARAAIEKAYGEPLENIFEWFGDEPLAAASVAQVHPARLHGQDGQPGMDVVVKVLRPNVREDIRRDLELMHLLASLAARHIPETRRLRPREVVAEYERVIYDELDLIREAANCSQLRRNWLGSDLIYHPVVMFEHTRENVLVMERIRGIRIDDIEALQAEQVNFEVLAARGVEIFFKQVFRDNFFHADMHPGNIFVDVSNPERPRYIGVDFGIVGSLLPSDQRYLAENFLAFFNHDYKRVAELHIDSGWVPESTRVDEFEGAIRSVCEPIFNKPLAEISFGAFLIRLFATARRFNMEVQPQLVLLQKTVLNIEGLGRILYPQLDLWATAKPILEEWMRDRLNPSTALRELQPRLPAILDNLPETLSYWSEQPMRARDAERARQADMRRLEAEIHRSAARTQFVIAGAALLVAGPLAAAVLEGAPGWTAGAGMLAGLACWATALFNRTPTRP
ncbi:MAG: ubiquinone biosynthesis regulatory protein kinase UbiB [Salinisphaeraceae bacterium]|nr:ubiquinone biosynthesis regulatory protein kinase UbiB [Salinisphaeraceae bacterium]